MSRLAELPNVTCKLSGVSMYAHDCSIDSVRPWLEDCLGAFGPDRCMFGSNYPMDAAWSPSLQDLLDSYRPVIDEAGEAASRDIFASNAARLYNLGQVASEQPR